MGQAVTHAELNLALRIRYIRVLYYISRRKNKWQCMVFFTWRLEPYL